MNLPTKYEKPRSLDPSKVSDAISLLPYIPQVHHAIFRNLKKGKKVQRVTLKILMMTVR